MPHPLRKMANGRPVYLVPLIIFEDDMSGNQSKQWNKHYSAYFSNASLPRHLIEQEFYTRFICTSNTAEPLEMMSGVIESSR
jgi:hypothetical protein